MRVGVLCRGEKDQFEWANQLGFRSVEWIRFHESEASQEKADWRSVSTRIGEAAAVAGLRISALGALYQNPLDPKQTDYARRVFHRAIEVAAHLGVRTVCGFPGAVLETHVHERGGNVVYRPFENYIPQLVAFWDPIASFANDHGVRIAFEHCPQGAWHLPIMGYNMLAQPAMWERFFNATRAENVGIEWDASHLVCQWIDPVANIHHYGSRIFHVHAKDALINRALLERYGICHPGVAEHRFPGLGQSNWAEIVHALLRAGYDSDLNVEGRHDPVYRDHDAAQPEDVRSHGEDKLAGRKLEDAGLILARKTLEPLVAGTE